MPSHLGSFGADWLCRKIDVLLRPIRGWLSALTVMTFDFDTVPARLGTDSQKWQKYAGRDILPLWVADMDFKSSPAIIAALHARVEQGIFGYARPVKSTTDAVVDAMQQRYGWRIDPSWLVWLPGLVVGLNVTAQAFAEPDRLMGNFGRRGIKDLRPCGDRQNQQHQKQTPVCFSVWHVFHGMTFSLDWANSLTSLL